MPIFLVSPGEGEALPVEPVRAEEPPRAEEPVRVEEPRAVEPVEPRDETPVKRGRGRPAGSKNKAKAVPTTPAPRPPIITAPVEEPPPRHVERRPRAPRKREYVAEPESPPESPPETPRSYRARVQREYREIRVSQHAERRDHFSSLLNRFMH